MLILLTQCNNCIKWVNLCFIVIIAIIKQKGGNTWECYIVTIYSMPITDLMLKMNDNYYQIGI